jgi:8-oxo-dGTP diphosphatase
VKTVEVVAGIILDERGRIFCVQRGESSKPYISKKWEFPGGKLEAGETRDEALIRELKEELKIDVVPIEFVTTIDHTYPDFRLIMQDIE